MFPFKGYEVITYFGIHPELNWLEQVARVRSTSHIHPDAHNTGRFFPIGPKMGRVGSKNSV